MSRTRPEIEPAGAAAPAAGKRIVAIVAGCVLAAVVIALYAQDAAIGVATGLFSDGWIIVGWVGAAALLGSVILRAMRIEADGALRLVTSAALGLGMYSLCALGLGLLGWLNRPTALLLPVGSAALWLLVQWRRGDFEQRFEAARQQVEASLNESAGWGWLWLAAMPALAIAVLGASVMPGWLWKPFDPHPYDVMEYHLEVAREWYELGRIVPLYHNVYNFFPAGMEMHHLAGMHIKGGPWAAMYLAQYFSVACMLLAVVGAYAIVKERVGRPQGIVGAVLMAGVPWLIMLAAVAYVESMLLLYTVAAMAWVMRALDRPEERWRAMAVGGMLAGFACGVKYTAAPTVLVFLPMALVLTGLLRWRERLWARMIVPSILFGLIGTALFAPWMARNAAWTGNPLFPLALRTLGPGHFDENQVERFERAHRVSEDHASFAGRAALAAQGLFDWQYGWVVMPAGIVGLGAGLSRRSTRQTAAFLGILAALQLVFWVFFTHLMARFAVQLVPIAAVAAGLALPGRRIVLALAGISAAGAALLGWVLLHAAFAPYVDPEFRSLVRLASVDALMPKMLEAQKSAGGLALIGDVQPFFHTMPADKLLYRTIFDVRFEPGVDVLDAWLGKPVSELSRDHIVIVHPGELRRLYRTYLGVTPLAPDWRRRLDAIYEPQKPIHPPEHEDAPVVYLPKR